MEPTLGKAPFFMKGVVMHSTKQSMDWHIQEVLTCELLRVDPNNEMLEKFLGMQNHFGAEMRKIKKFYEEQGKWPPREPGSLC